MQLGWIDFSKSDRDKVLSVIQLLKTPGALDELGIGSIRDAFANYFFPGISTIQTRAKYFLIVPYVLKEAGEGKYGTNLDQVIRKIDDRERECGLKLIENDKNGVIGLGSHLKCRMILLQYTMRVSLQRLRIGQGFSAGQNAESRV